MTDRIEFKLAYAGNEFEFATVPFDDQLFLAVKERVSNFVKERMFEIFWNDGESDIVLASSSDLSTAIDFATRTRKSVSKPPCVHLTVVAEAMDAAAVAAAEARMKEGILHLIDTARAENWNAGLRSILALLYSPETQELQQLSERNVAAIAVELALLEKRVPEGLRMLMQEIPDIELGQFFYSEWWMKEARERAGVPVDHDGYAAMPPLDRALSPLRAVLLALELVSYVETPDRMLRSDEMREIEQREGAENEAASVEEYEPDCWDRQAEAIARLAENRMRNPVYFNAAEVLRQTETADVATVETPVETAPESREERIRQNLHSHASAPPDTKPSTTLFEIMEHRHFVRLLKAREWCQNTASEIIADHIRWTVEGFPEDLLRELREARPDVLAKVVMVDWAEEQEKATEEEWKSSNCCAHTLNALLLIGVAAAMYPPELREVYDINVEAHNKRIEERMKEIEEDKADADDDLRLLGVGYVGSNQKVPRGHVFIKTCNSLKKYVCEMKASKFTGRVLMSLLPPRESRKKPTPEELYPAWAALVESLEMTGEMKAYVDDPSLVRAEIIAELYQVLAKMPEKIQKKILKNIGKDIAWTLTMGLYNEVCRKKEAARQWRKENPGVEQEPTPTEYFPAALAARLFIAAADQKTTPQYLEKQLSKLNACKSTTIIEAEGTSVAVDESMKERVEQQAASIIELALATFIPVFEQQLQQPNEDPKILAAREKELKIREKALEMMEEVFERKAAEWQEKMKKLEGMLEDIDARVEKIEVENNSEDVDKMEEKDDEADMEIV